MKQFKSLIVALVMIVGATSFVNAQSKIAHINSQELVASMPEMRAAQSQLEKVQKTYEVELKTLNDEFNATVTKYDGEASSKTQEENAKRVQEVQELQNRINDFRQTALKDLEQKQSDLFNPIIDKARKAIQKVGRALGYQYVIDVAGSGVILFEGPDLLAAVKKELGI